MKRSSFWLSTLLVVAAAGLLLASACAPKQQTGVVDVTAKGLSFSPATVTVSPGTTVRWTNKDNTAHQPSSAGFTPGGPNPKGSWSLQPINPEGTGSRKFDQKGTFEYECLIHTYMRGTVIVK